MPYNALSGYELAAIIGQQVTEKLRQHGDYSIAICYDNPQFEVTIKLEAQELDPRSATVKGFIKTETPPGVPTAARSSNVRIGSEILRQPDKEREEHNLVVPTREENPRTGEVSDLKADNLGF